MAVRLFLFLFTTVILRLWPQNGDMKVSSPLFGGVARIEKAPPYRRSLTSCILCIREAYSPLGFFSVKFHKSAHISSTPYTACQPSSSAAFVQSA